MTTLHREQNYYHFKKEQFVLINLFNVKNINKLQYTEEELVTFICPARQFIFLNLYFETVYNFSFSSVGGGRREQIDFFFPWPWISCSLQNWQMCL